MSRPGELVHFDIKKLGRIPKGGGWQIHGRVARPASYARKAAIGYAYVHSAVDGYSRLAYSEVLANEQAATTIGFWLRAQAFFAAHDIRIERVLTDNGPCYRAKSSPSHSATSATPLHGPTDQPPMERLNASTGPCWSSGLMHNPGTQRVKETELLTVGSISTTITDTTLPSEVLR